MDTYNYVFYKIECLDSNIDFRYVGSTRNFKNRISLHKHNCNSASSRDYNTKKYKFIRANGGWSNFNMVQIGTKEKLTKREAEQIEEEYRQELDANMNGKRCYTTDEQKKEIFKDKKKEYDKKYRENNKEKIKQKVTCECGCKVNYKELTKHKKNSKTYKFIKNKIK
jgi:hypothetical protein